MRRIVIFGVAFAVVSVLATSAFANTRLRAHPELFDPGASGAPSASWEPGTGLPGSGNPADHGLILGMSANVTFPPGASADATVNKVGGLVLASLSFDHLLGTQCGGGAPRWNLEFTDGSVYGIPCNEGTHTPIAFTTWESITFSCADPSAAAPLSGPGGCAFGKTLTFAQVGFDFCTTCPGSTTLDNLELNGCVMGKPGNSNVC